MRDVRILFILQNDIIDNVNFRHYYNSGDNVYFTSGISLFYNKNICAKFILQNDVRGYLKDNPQWARENFDFAITMEANIFGRCYSLDGTLLRKTNLIKLLKIPFYVLGAGAQSSLEYDCSFIKDFESDAKRYLDAIYQSGGNITLRGNFTRRVLEELGYKKLFVSGCPSLFLNYKNINISNDKVDFKCFKPMFNAQNLNQLSIKLYENYPNSVFFDQSVYMKLLYEPENIENFENFLYPTKVLYAQNRIKGNMNYFLWRKQIIDGGYNFSYGSRIHGNIIALQNNIPAFVKVIDSRTREIAEFFNIPNNITIPFEDKKDNLYELYSSLNYEKFNNTVREKARNFKEFLDKNGIPNTLGEDSKYLKHLSELEYFEKKSEINIDTKILKKLPNKKTWLSKFFLTGDKKKKIKINIFGIKITI